MSDDLSAERARLDGFPAVYADFAFDRLMRGYMLRTFRPWLPSSPGATRALEMGCHHGAFSALAAPLFGTFEIVEAADAFLSRTLARPGLRATGHLSLFEDFAPPHRYDAVFALHVLEHLLDPVAVLSRARSWLKPGGRLLIAVPNGMAPSRQIAVEMGIIPTLCAPTEADVREGHRRTYLPDTLAADVRAAGLRIVARGGVLFKALANFQMDRLLAVGAEGERYLEGCYALGTRYPDLCASLFIVAEDAA